VTGRPLHVALSTFYQDASSVGAASAVLGSADPNEEIDRLYPLLVRHKSLTNAMSHLERAGGDLQRLTISWDRFRSTWPLAPLLPGVREDGGRVSLAMIRDHLEDHFRRLERALLELVDLTGEDQFLPIGGMALRVAYPDYSDRMGYDVDVFAHDLHTGLRLLECLRSAMGFALNRCRVSRAGGHWAAVFQTFRSGEDGHDVHVDLMAGGHPVGPGVIPLWFRAPLVDRARSARLEDHVLLVPSPEDMLLVMAVREQRKRAFSRRDINDAGFVLKREGRLLDWDYLCSSARSHGVAGVLLELAGEAERLTGERLVPPLVRARLAPPRLEGRLLAMAAAGGTPERRTLSGSAVGVLRRGWPVLWSFRYVRREKGRVGAVAGLLSARLQARAFLVTSRGASSKSPAARLLLPVTARLHPRLGSLCQARREPVPPGSGWCLSRVRLLRGMTRRIDPEGRAVLREIARALPDPLTQRAPRIRRPDARVSLHRCRAFLFFLDRL
jgi:hypothetical protein